MTPCPPHAWVIEPATGVAREVLPGHCRKCGARRTWPAGGQGDTAYWQNEAKRKKAPRMGPRGETTEVYE